MLSKLRLDEDGRLVLGDTRMILTTRELFRVLQEVAEDILGEMGAATLFYRVFFNAAYHFAGAQAKLFGLKGFEVLKKYLEIGSVRGWWAGYEIVELSDEPLKVIVRLHHTLAEEWGNVGRAICHSWRGGIAGMLRHITEQMGKDIKIKVQETACIAKGDSYCEMVAEQVD